MSRLKQMLGDALVDAAARLEVAGIEESRREAASLAAFVLNKEPVFLIAHPEYQLSNQEVHAFESAVSRRVKREPFHYITGTKEFYGLDFAVGPGVLIPRPETELLVEQAIELLDGIAKPRILEIGVGSGCISVSILHHVENSIAEGVEISSVAIEIARSNAIRHNVADRLKLSFGDVFDGTSGKFHLIISNPPYIPDGDLDELQAEVGEFEPHRALFAGSDGLSVVRRIVADAPEFLRSQGFLLIEIGFGQAASVKELFDGVVWSDFRFICDLQDIERIVVAKIRD